MTYTPKNVQWYLAELVMEYKIEGDSRNVIHINTILVRADLLEEAFEKAEQLGRQGEDTYCNEKNQQVIWKYRGLRDLNFIYEELEHGAELIFEEKINLSEDEVQEIITSKSQLNVFCPNNLKDSSKPDYSCQEIMDEVRGIISDNRTEPD